MQALSHPATEPVFFVEVQLINCITDGRQYVWCKQGSE